MCRDSKRWFKGLSTTTTPCRAPLLIGSEATAGDECSSWYASTQACGPAFESEVIKTIISFDHSDHPVPVSIPCHLNWRRRPTLEISCQCQGQRNPALIQFPVHVRPGSNKHDCFCGITSGRMEYCIDILSAICNPRSFVLIFLPCDFQTSRSKNLAQLFCDPIGRGFSAATLFSAKSLMSHTPRARSPPMLELRFCKH